MMEPLALHEQIRCAQKEVAMRRKVYPKLVGNGKMTQAEADYQIAQMTGIVTTLKTVLRQQEEQAQMALFGVPPVP